MAQSIGPGLTNYLRIFQQNSSYIYVHVRLSVVTTILRHGLTEISPKMDKISILTAKTKSQKVNRLACYNAAVRKELLTYLLVNALFVVALSSKYCFHKS